MSNLPPLFTDEIQAWDRYAAAALGGLGAQGQPCEKTVQAAAELADGMLRERQKRIKAAKEQLFQH